MRQCQRNENGFLRPMLQAKNHCVFYNFIFIFYVLLFLAYKKRILDNVHV